MLRNEMVLLKNVLALFKFGFDVEVSVHFAAERKVRCYK